MRLFLLLTIATCLFAQDFNHSEVRDNPARFNHVWWVDTFTVPKNGDGKIIFPAYISTYQMPSCVLLDAETKKAPPNFTWTKVSQTEMGYKAQLNEAITISCWGYMIKPWRKDKGIPVVPRHVPQSPGGLNEKR